LRKVNYYSSHPSEIPKKENLWTSLTVHLLEMSVALPHLFDYYAAEVSIRYVVVSLLVHLLAQLYKEIKLTPPTHVLTRVSAPDHQYLRLLVLVQSGHYQVSEASDPLPGR
jgi:hypothetical protein